MDQELIRFRRIKYKIKYYKNVYENIYSIDNISSIEHIDDYCYGSDQYIKKYIEFLKDNIIRSLPKLNKMKMYLSVIDKDNILHRLLVDSFNMVCKILKMNCNNNLYKTIVVVIYYENQNIFMGGINFDGIK